MKVLVCGGRDFSDVPLLWRTLDQIDDTHLITWLIDGASDDVTGPYKGADYWANQWAHSTGTPFKRVHADWKAFGKGAGPKRNQKMLDDGKPDLVVAFPGGRGTSDMITRAKAAGVEVREIVAHPQETEDKV